jgi:nondiscriminating aspartyl-tRNA synthetase
VTGVVEASAQAPAGGELRVSDIELLSQAETPPFDLFRPELGAALPTMLDHAALSLRHHRRAGAIKVAAASMTGFRSTLDSLGFMEIRTPKIVGTATESGANVFPIEYFGRRAYLAQSPQFYKQMMVGVFERVYEVGPVFRAEPHDTPRHLNEYTSLDAEIGFIRDHQCVMRVLRQVVAGMIDAVSDMAARGAAPISLDLPEVPGEIPAVTFRRAQSLLVEAMKEDLPDKDDLSPAQERWLGDWVQRTHGSDFLFVTGYPRARRPFYTHPDPSEPDMTNGFDLLFRGTELVTAGQRLHLLEDYQRALSEHAINASNLSGYLDAFRYGMPPHGGFAIGLERWVAQLTGIANIREVTAFPRDMNRLVP